MRLLIILAAAVLTEGRDNFKVDSRIFQSETSNVFVTFTEGTEQVLQAIVGITFESRKDKIWALHDSLEALALRVQAVTKGVLGKDFEYRSLWISNQLYIKQATIQLVLELANLPEVKTITVEEIIQLDTIVNGPIVTSRPKHEEEWGIKKIQASEARKLLNNVTTKFHTTIPIVVATIDTGVKYTHEALMANWIGEEYGWFDPYDFNLLPIDLEGHGTHTMGSICGAGGIGVFPEAHWMSCRGCATTSCSQFALLACAEWITCPTLSDGSGADCSKAPRLVSNSWNGGRAQEWFDKAISVFHLAEIIPLFSIGNSGPNCNTANSPGDRNVIGVGSTTIDDALSPFSSLGPTIDYLMKPEISAPGSEILSAYNTADNAYNTLSGTSMAVPHVAGSTALLLAYNPNLTYKEIITFLTLGTDKDLVQTGKFCNGVPDYSFPNFHYGEGRLNAFHSLSKLIERYP